MRKFALLVFLLVVPFTVSAAGFAKDTLFFSKPSIIEGETVLIHTVVSNDTDGAIAAEVTFAANNEELGSLPASLKPGEAATVSLSWKPEAGIYNVTATFNSEHAEPESRDATFEVKPKPSSNSAEVAGTSSEVQSSAFIESKIEEYSPATASSLSPAFDFIDSARERGAKTLDTQIEWAKEKIGKKPGIIAGEQTEARPWTDTLFFAIYTLYFYLLTVIRYILANAAVFYPVAVLLFFYLLWKMLRRIRRRT